MRTYFVTCNKNKFIEIKSYIPNLAQLCIENSIEVQSLDSKYIIREKLLDANSKAGNNSGILIVEDTGLYLNVLNGFPGPLIKFMLKSIGNEGIFNICNKLNNCKAEATTSFGIYDSKTNDISFYSATIEGVITSPRGNFGFGWDQIFIPNGSDKSFAEMDTTEEKNRYSMRIRALKKLLEKLNNYET